MHDSSQVQPPSKGRRSLALGVLAAIAAVIALDVVLHFRTRKAKGWDTSRLTGQLYYVSIAAVRGGPPPPRGPLAEMRFHFFVHNRSNEDYVIPSGTRLQILERQGTWIGPAPRSVSAEAPRATVPAAQDVEVVVRKPYPAEVVDLEKWSELYPDAPPPPAESDGGVRRAAMSVAVAASVMKQRGVTPERLVERFDIVGDDNAHECTRLAQAVLHRRFPRITGFALSDEEHRIRIELPVAPK